MSPFSKKFEKAYAKVLLRIAEGDIRTAEVLSTHLEIRGENTCYLVQQAVEKTLKAVICHLEIPTPLTHDIAALLAAIPEKCARPPHETDLVVLTEFATVRRYEEGYYQLTAEEIVAATKLGRQVVEWAKTIIK